MDTQARSKVLVLFYFGYRILHTLNVKSTTKGSVFTLFCPIRGYRNLAIQKHHPKIVLEDWG